MWDFMGIHTGIILLNIFIICVISIAIVKIYYRKHAEADIDINLFGSYSFFTNRTKKDTDKIILENEKIISQANRNYSNNRPYLTGQNNQNNLPMNNPHKQNPYAMKNNNYNPYNTQRQKEGDRMSPSDPQNVNVGKIEKKDVAEKINEVEKDKLVTTDQSTKKETYTEIKNAQPQGKDQELKDLFTIDELIKESKRKTTPTPSSPSPSSNTNKNNDIPQFLTPEERESMKDHVEEMENELNQKAAERKQKEEANKVANETVTEVYKHTQSPINSPILKTPRKTETSINDVIKETVEQKIEEYPPQVDESTKKETYTDIAESQPRTQDQPLNNNIFNEATTVNVEEGRSEDDDEYDDLDYRKDLARITNRVKNSKIFNDVKNKLKVEEEVENNPTIDEEFLRNVRSYDSPDEADVIVPEREFDDFETPYIEPEKAETKKDIAKKLHINPPKKEIIDLKINNNPAKLKKGDEIIFKYHGDTYSSSVLRINGDDIYVKFRGKYITIKPSDVKKIF